MTEQTTKAVDTATTQLFERKIGKTLYQVNVAFSKESNESMQDKVERLIKKEALKFHE